MSYLKRFALHTAQQSTCTPLPPLSNLTPCCCRTPPFYFISNPSLCPLHVSPSPLLPRTCFSSFSLSSILSYFPCLPELSSLFDVHLFRSSFYLSLCVFLSSLSPALCFTLHCSHRSEYEDLLAAPLTCYYLRQSPQLLVSNH